MRICSWTGYQRRLERCARRWPAPIPTTETITASTPDIADGGDLFRGNQQIHPPLKKTCP